MRIIKVCWRVLVGVKDALVLLLLLLFFGALYMALSIRPEAPAPVGSGALLIDLAGVITETSERPSIADLLMERGGVRQFRERDLLTALDAAAADPAVKALVLNLDGFMGAGHVSLGGVGEAIGRVRARKPVFAYASFYSDDAYTLAAYASEIWVNPLGGAMFAGAGGSHLYFKGLIDRLGVDAHIYRVGMFKSAVEPFMRADQSPEARTANQALADSLWQGWLKRISIARPKAQAQAYAADPVAVMGGDDPAHAAVKAGLVDQIGSIEAFEARVAKVAGGGKDPLTAYARIDYANWQKGHMAGSSGGRVGIITVAGPIVDGESGRTGVGGDTIAGLVNHVLAGDRIRALVLRIDSPGGSALASERMRTALIQARAHRIPVVVSMGNVAASGGYWIATAGDRIFAEPDTITGSIGVFGVIPTFRAALAKIGVTVDGVATTPLSGQPDVIGGTNPMTDALLQHGVEATYARFLALVSEARRLPVTRVNEIAQGRVWAGGDARQLGLVDRFGDLNDAVAAAAKAANLSGDEAGAVWIEPAPTLPQQIADALAQYENLSSRVAVRDVFGFAASRQAVEMSAALADARLLVTGGGIQARCLECPRGAALAGALPADDGWLARLWRAWR